MVFCNCDDPEESNFWKFFERKFEFLRLKKLVSTHYVPEGHSYKLEIVRGKSSPRIVKMPLTENGDFRSAECVSILKNADIVVANLRRQSAVLKSRLVRSPAQLHDLRSTTEMR